MEFSKKLKAIEDFNARRAIYLDLLKDAILKGDSDDCYYYLHMFSRYAEKVEHIENEIKCCFDIVFGIDSVD